MPGVEHGERIDPARIEGVRWVRRWRSGDVSEWRCRYVSIGTLPDGRWFAQRSKAGARAYPSGAQAYDVAVQLMADRDDWVESPAEPGAHGPGEGWRRQGGNWVRDDS